jgi:hypothetical protein
MLEHVIVCFTKYTISSGFHLLPKSISLKIVPDTDERIQRFGET